MPAHRKLALLICSIAALLGSASPVSAGSVSHRCASADACIAAVSAAAKEGKHVAGLAAMIRLSRFPAPPGPIYAEYPKKLKEIIDAGDLQEISRAFVSSGMSPSPWSPEINVALALHYLQLKRYDDAARVLRRALAAEPYHAVLWDALATTLAAQGKQDDAVGALLVAHEWALAPDRVLAVYDLAAQSGEAMYREASRLIRANVTAQAAYDASLPPLPNTKDDLRGYFRCTLKTQPNWPKSSLRLEQEGTLTLAFFIDANGMLVRAKKLKSSGIAALDNAALLGVAGCDFRPAVRDGKQQPSWIKLDYVWEFEK